MDLTEKIWGSVQEISGKRKPGSTLAGAGENVPHDGVSGTNKRGRFVEGVWGEQFALSEAIVELRKSKKENKSNVLVAISAADPLNLTGIITPGRRVHSFFGNRILYQDGNPIAFMEAKEVQFLVEPEKEKMWSLRKALVQRPISPKLRKYLGKGVY